jgi:hypothetical protein
MKTIREALAAIGVTGAAALLPVTGFSKVSKQDSSFR